MPAYMRVAPITALPNTLKMILSSIGGSCRSASLARAAGASASAAIAAGAMNRVQFWALAMSSSLVRVPVPEGRRGRGGLYRWPEEAAAGGLYARSAARANFMGQEC